LLDTAYVVGFFAVMTVATVAVHFVAKWALDEGVDSVIVWVLRITTWMLATIDAVGVVLGAWFTLRRFVAAMADDE
jgi:hypothetical protein